MSVSAIVTVYNNEKYLSRCIDSLLNQDLLPLEIILVYDKGSTDKSLEICMEYMRKRPDIILVHEIEHAYVGVARNKGAEIAKGKYIYFVDGDDTVPQNATSLMYDNFFVRLGADVVYGDVLEIFSTGKTRVIKGILENKVCGTFVHAIMYERNLYLEHLKCDESILTHEDRRSGYLVNAYAKNPHYMFRVVYNHHVNPGSNTNGDNDKLVYMIFDVFEVIKDLNKHRDKFSADEWKIIQNDIAWPMLTGIIYISRTEDESLRVLRATNWIKRAREEIPEWPELDVTKRLLTKPIFKDLLEMFIYHDKIENYIRLTNGWKMKIINLMANIYAARGLLNYLRTRRMYEYG